MALLKSPKSLLKKLNMLTGTLSLPKYILRLLTCLSNLIYYLDIAQNSKKEECDAKVGTLRVSKG